MDEQSEPSTATKLQNILSQLSQPLNEQPKITRHKFTAEEDEVLRFLVNIFGTENWETLARYFPGRSARQCRERWKHYIDPQVIIGNWSPEDDQLLCDKVGEFGNKWATIAQFFPGRTDIGVKNHYCNMRRWNNLVERGAPV
jgi:hypothetical protein